MNQSDFINITLHHAHHVISQRKVMLQYHVLCCTMLYHVRLYPSVPLFILCFVFSRLYYFIMCIDSCCYVALWWLTSYIYNKPNIQFRAISIMDITFGYHTIISPWISIIMDLMQNLAAISGGSRGGKSIHGHPSKFAMEFAPPPRGQKE